MKCSGAPPASVDENEKEEQHGHDVTVAVDVALLELVPPRLAREEAAQVCDAGLEVVRIGDVVEGAPEELLLE